MKNSAGNAYFRFNLLMDALHHSPSFPLLNDIEKKILDMIAEASLSGKPLLISHIVFGNPIGSPATLSKKITSLVKKNLVVYSTTDDARKKYLDLTPMSKQYYTKLNDIVILASNKS